MRDSDVDLLVPYEERYEAIRKAVRKMDSVKKWLRVQGFEVSKNQTRALTNAVISYCYQIGEAVFVKRFDSGSTVTVFEVSPIETIMKKLMCGPRNRRIENLTTGLARVSKGTDWALHPSCCTVDGYWEMQGQLMAKGRRKRAYERLCKFDDETKPRCHEIEISMDECNMDWKPLHPWGTLEALVADDWCRG
jgi:hypothetical protein